MNPGKFKMAAIDLDGTLIDSAPDIAYALDRMLEAAGKQPQGIDTVHKFIGNGLARLVKRTLTGKMWSEPPEPVFKSAFEQFMQLYAEHNGLHSSVYPGVFDALQQLQTLGMHLCCITNKDRQFAEPLLEHFGLNEYFELLICGDDLPAKKPDPLPLHQALQHWQLQPGECLMIGDSITDIKTARAAGTRVAAVNYGYNHGEDIQLANPDWVIDSIAEICTILRDAA